MTPRISPHNLEALILLEDGTVLAVARKTDRRVALYRLPGEWVEIKELDTEDWIVVGPAGVSFDAPTGAAYLRLKDYDL